MAIDITSQKKTTKAEQASLNNFKATKSQALIFNLERSQ